MALSSQKFSSPASSIVSLGRVQRPKGLNGQMRVTTRGEILAQLKKNDVVTLYQAEGMLYGYLQQPSAKEKLTIEEVLSVFPDYIVLSAKSFNSPEQVQAIQGFYFGLDRKSPPAWFAPQDNEFYLFEYVGLRVYDQTGKAYGQVARVEDNIASPLLVIKLEKTRQEILLPQQAPYVGKPQRAKASIVIENFTDFLDVYNSS